MASSYLKERAANRWVRSKARRHFYKVRTHLLDVIKTLEVCRDSITTLEVCRDSIMMLEVCRDSITTLEVCRVTRVTRGLRSLTCTYYAG